MKNLNFVSEIFFPAVSGAIGIDGPVAYDVTNHSASAAMMSGLGFIGCQVVRNIGKEVHPAAGLIAAAACGPAKYCGVSFALGGFDWDSSCKMVTAVKGSGNQLWYHAIPPILALSGLPLPEPAVGLVAATIAEGSDEFIGCSAKDGFSAGIKCALTKGVPVGVEVAMIGTASSVATSATLVGGCVLLLAGVSIPVVPLYGAALAAGAVAGLAMAPFAYGVRQNFTEPVIGCLYEKGATRCASDAASYMYDAAAALPSKVAGVIGNLVGVDADL